ncbi:receptor-like protein kinase, partial [Trifolium pratense]
RKLSEDSYSHSETRKMLSTIVVGTPGYIAPGCNDNFIISQHIMKVELCKIVFSNMFTLSPVTENAYVIVQSRKSDVYSYGVVLLEIITRKKVVVPCLNDETNVTSLVSWARSLWLETGKIEYIADSYLAEAFPNSEALTKQVTTMFLLALQCTDKDLRKRPIMKDVIGLFKKDMFKCCDEEEYGSAAAADTSLQPTVSHLRSFVYIESEYREWVAQIVNYCQIELSKRAARPISGRPGRASGFVGPG